MKSFDVQDFVKRPSVTFLAKSVEEIPVQEALDVAPLLIELLDKVVATKNADILKSLYDKNHELELMLLSRIWSGKHSRFLERLVNYPINNDDWDAVSNTVSALESWISTNKTVLKSKSKRKQKVRREFLPSEMTDPVKPQREQQRFEKQMLDAAIYAKKRILFQLRQFAERHFNYIKGDKRDEFKSIVQISGTILNQSSEELILWRDYLRALVYAEYTLPLKQTDWISLYNEGERSIVFKKIFGTVEIRDTDILLSIKDWALHRMSHSIPTDKKRAEKLLKIQKKIMQLVQFIKEEANYERGQDIGLYDSEKEELQRILGNVSVWRDGVFRHIQSRTCVGCSVNQAVTVCSRCKIASYCGKSCQTRDWLKKHANNCK